MPRSTFYYYLKRMKLPDKHKEAELIIKQIFAENKGRYGYRRITLEMHNRGYSINHKLVQKLMKKNGLKCEIRRKKYKSYKGEIGKVAPNILKRDFKSNEPLKKLVTDVTEFAVKDEKVYLSPILDLDKAFEIIPDGSGAILHSDQGWQYQMKPYQKRLKDKGIVQSMSRKGNCLDNSVMENFFGLLKSEMYYRHEFNSTDELMVAIKEYIDYYNNKRIKEKLKGLSPVQYRTKSIEVA